MPKSDLDLLPPVFRYSEALQSGISAERLYSYRDSGAIIQVARGLYTRPEGEFSNFDLLEISYRSPKATLCLLSALAWHDLTDIIPPTIDIALPKGSRSPQLSAPVSVHFFKRDTFDLGRNTVEFEPGHEIALYSPERTLVDAIRLRHSEGPEIAWEALRRWLRRRGSSPAQLLKMAQSFHGAERAVRDALDIVL